MQLNKLSKQNKIVKCRSCGANAHQSIDGNYDVCLCRKCYDDSEMELSHNDGLHSEEPDKDCFVCMGLNPNWKK